LCWLALLAVVFTSCLELGGGPRIREFRAEPTRVSRGEEVLLSWRVESLSGGSLSLHALTDGSGDGALSLGDVTNQNSTAVITTETTTYRLTASGPRGSTSRDTTVSVIGDGGGGDEGGPTIGYLRASPATGVEPGQPVQLEWAVQDAERVTLEPPGEAVSPTGQKTVSPHVTTTYMLIASNEAGTTRASVTVQVETCNCLLFLVAGQSNATGYGLEEAGEFPSSETEEPEEGVMMLTPELEWVRASEPTHPGAKHSFGLRFAKEVRAATSSDVFLVPAAVGGSALDGWQPGEEYFEVAANRAKHAADSLGLPVAAVLWLQGESESKYASRRRNFVDQTDNVFQGFHERLPGSPEVLFVQLSKRLFHGTVDGDNEEGHNLAYQAIREAQRLMEAGAKDVGVGSSAESSSDRPHYRMVVSHDLPMSDVKHLSAEGQRYLGRRLAHAFVQSIWQGGGQGPVGPRVESMTIDDERADIVVDLTMAVNSSSSYDAYFTVFDTGGDGSPRKREYASIGRDPGDTSRIRIEFDSPLSGDVEVRYMPPDDTALYQWSSEAVHATVGDLRLPLPAFNGPVEPLPQQSFPGVRTSTD
jgi:hypothetical protein